MPMPGDVSRGIVINAIAQRSTFVTVVAWIFIVLSGFSTMISILQNLMVHVMFAQAEMQEALQQAQLRGGPPMAALMLRYMPLFVFGFLVLSATTLTASIGLLRRRNWARLLFIGLMGLGVLWNVGGLALQLTMFSSMRQEFGAAPADMSMMLVVMTVFASVLVLAFVGLFGWIAARLLSPAIAAEFRP